MAATKVSVHLKEVALGEEFVLEHAEGGSVQVYEIDYRDGSMGRFIAMFALTEPISDEEARKFRENPPKPGAPAERYPHYSSPADS